MRFGTWNVRSLYRSGSLTTAARELDLVGVQEVRWEKGLKLNGAHEFWCMLMMLIYWMEGYIL